MTTLARRLVQPDFQTGPVYVETYGPAVADLNASIGFAPDPQQQLALDLIFAIRGDLTSAAFEVAVIVARQNLKTGLFKQTALGWLYVTDQRLIVWSAHEMSTTREAHRDLADLIRDAPALRKRLKASSNEGIYDANGEERIELATGQRILFKARTQSGGRGLSGDKVILDEAFALQPSHVGSLLPTMLAREDPQVVYGSSAGKVTSDVLRDIRNRGRMGTSPRLAYLEWCAPVVECATTDCEHPKDAPQRGIDCALDRVDLIEKANPTITTGRIRVETVQALRQALPPEEFMRECFGWWEDPLDGTATVFGPGKWQACLADPEALGQPTTTGLSIGVAVDVDQQWTSLAAGSRWDDDRLHVAPTEDLDSQADRRRGSLWVPARCKQLQDRYGCAVVIDEKTPDPSLIKALEDAGVQLTKLKVDEVLGACAALFNEVRDAQLTHFGTPELDEAVVGAAQQPVGDRWRWGRRKSTTDVSMLEAATLAAHGAREGLSSSSFNIW